MAPMVKLDALHSRQKRPDLEGKASMGAEVTAFFNTSKACCSAAPHDQSFDFRVSAWRGQAISEKFMNPMKDWTSFTFVGCGQSMTPWTLTGSIATWCRQAKNQLLPGLGGGEREICVIYYPASY